jgi:hypothetical protein
MDIKVLYPASDTDLHLPDGFVNRTVWISNPAPREAPSSSLTLTAKPLQYAAETSPGLGDHGCSTLRNGQIFKQVIDACQSSAVAVLAGCAGLV